MKQRGTTVTVRYVKDSSKLLKWGVFWNEYHAGRTGRPTQRAKFYATEAEAQEVQRAVVEELAHPTPVTAPVRTHRAADTLAVFADTIWLPFVKERRSGATHKNYAYIIEHWLAPAAGHKRYPGLGNLVLNDTTFTTLQIVQHLEALYQAGVSLSMRKRVKTALSACLSHARFVGRLTTQANPCSQVGRTIKHKGEEHDEAQPNPFTPDEITRIFDQLTAVEDPCWQAYFLWQYHVGTRPGEASALKWTALDLDRKRGRINFSYCPVDKIDKDPKTHERRTVDLTDTLITKLLEWRKVQREAAFRRGLLVPAYVFTTQLPARHTRQLTRIFQNGNVRLVLARTLKACGITGHTLYDFRDSFATSHLVLGWDRKLAWVSKQLGHKTPTTTAQHYYAYRDTTASASFADEIGGWQ